VAVKNLINTSSNPQGPLLPGNTTFHSPLATISPLHQQERSFSLKPSERKAADKSGTISGNQKQRNN